MIKVTATGGGWLLAGEVVTKYKVSYIGAPSPIILDTWILHCGYKLGHEDTWILDTIITIYHRYDAGQKSVETENRIQLSLSVAASCC